jgi:hypothetical protein
MHHRYGRHGPHAWLRQRERRHARPSLTPDSVVSPTIIRVFVPTATERIIVIIMTNSSQFDDWNEIKVVEAQSKVSLLQSTDQQENTSIANHAIWKALDDVGEIQGLARKGTFLIINQEELHRRHSRNLCASLGSSGSPHAHAASCRAGSDLCHSDQFY